MQRTTTTRIYTPRGAGLCGLAAAPPVVATASPALSPCAAAAALRAQSAAAAAAAAPNVAAASGGDGTVLVAAPGHHHHHHADVPVRKDCGFPWWVVLVLVLGMILLGVWLWLKNRGRDGNVKPIVVGPVAPPRSPVTPPVAPPTSPVLPPASPAVVGGNGRPGSPVMAPMSPAYSPVMIQTPAPPSGQVVRPYGLVPLGTATKVTGDQVRADVEAGNPALVMYTSHGCYYCDQALPEIQKAAANLGVPVLIVDREDLAPADRPGGYPHIYAIAGPNDTRLFNGERTAEAFVRFVAQHLGMHYVRPGCM